MARTRRTYSEIVLGEFSEHENLRDWELSDYTKDTHSEEYLFTSGNSPYHILVSRSKSSPGHVRYYLIDPRARVLYKARCESVRELSEAFVWLLSDDPGVLDSPPECFKFTMGS